MVAAATEAGYLKGRSEAEAETSDKWLPSNDPALVARAKELKYISLEEICRNGSIKKKNKEIPLTNGMKIVCDEEVGGENAIKWLEWQQLFADLLDLYIIQGNHPEKASEMLTHYRLLQRFGNNHTFSYESIIKYDTHVRSRDEGQGPKLSWRYDAATRQVYLQDYVKKERAFTPPSFNSSTQTAKKPKFSGKKSTPPSNKSAGVCYEWIGGKVCTFKSCRFLHTCTACDISQPKLHNLDRCSMKEELMPRINMGRKKGK